jgi:hypothetical protein
MKEKDSDNNITKFATTANQMAMDWGAILAELNREVAENDSLLIEDKDFTKRVAWAIHYNFKKIPEETRNNLLLKLVSNESSRETARYVVEKNSDNFSAKFKFQLLAKLAGHEPTVQIFMDIYHQLDNNLQKKLPINLEDLKENILKIAVLLFDNFDNISGNLKKSLMQIAEKSETARFLAIAMYKEFNVIPDMFRNRLQEKILESRKKEWRINDDLLSMFPEFSPDKIYSLLEALTFENGIAYIRFKLEHGLYYLNDQTRAGLMSLLKNRPDNTLHILHVLSDHFTEVEENVRNDILLQLAADKTYAAHFIKIFERHFSEISDEVRNNILLVLAANDTGSDTIASLLIENYSELPEEIRNSLFRLAAGNNTAKSVAVILQYRFYNLPAAYRNELLEKMYINNDSVIPVANILNESYTKIPGPLRERLLDTIASYEQAEFCKLKILKYHFSKIPEAIRNKLLRNLSDRYKVAKPLAYLVKDNVEQINSEIFSEVCLRLYNHETGVRPVTYMVKDFFPKITENYRSKLLLKLMEHEQNFKLVAFIIGHNLPRLPENFRNGLLSRLSTEKQAIWGLISCMIKFFDIIPDPIRNNVLLNLGEFPETNKALKYIVRNHYEKISPELLEKFGVIEGPEESDG